RPLVLTAPRLGDAAGATDHAVKANCIAAIELQGAIVRHAAAARRSSAPITNRQGTGADGSTATVGVGARQRGGAAARLGHAANATDCAGKSNRIAAIELQSTVVGDITRNRASGTAITNRQGTGADGGAAAISIGAGQRQILS